MDLTTTSVSMNIINKDAVANLRFYFDISNLKENKKVICVLESVMKLSFLQDVSALRQPFNTPVVFGLR